MSDEIEFDAESSATTWAAFGDLMSVLLGRPRWRDSFDADMASFLGRASTMH